MKKFFSLSMFSFALILLLSSASEKITPSSDEAFVEYAGHGQDRGPKDLNLGYVQQPNELDAGRGKRLEALVIRAGEGSLPVELVYGGHFQGTGDDTGVSTGQILGSIGQQRRMEQLWIEVVGEYEDQYSIYYKIHQQDIGWTEWYRDGQKVGKRGKRIEAVKIKLVKK
jgi:uncharacterized protein YjdB